MRSAWIKLPGHPDKACDLVAEAIVDEYLKRDPESRLQISVSGGRGALFVSGDVRSQADYDVSAVVRRTLGSIGILGDVEPFISLEPVRPDISSVFLQGSEVPVTVFGYATSETPELLPATMVLARRIAKALDDRRQSDEAWFWLGPDAEVLVHAEASAPSRISIRVEHGTKPMPDVRVMISEFVSPIAPGVPVLVNELGPTEVRGLTERMGASGRDAFPYGSALPSSHALSGLDSHRAEKAGAWLARQVARSMIARGASASFVQATYAPGEREPMHVQIRDERGRDLRQDVPLAAFSLDRTKAWSRPNLHVDACRWGFAGESGLPWEDEGKKSTM